MNNFKNLPNEILNNIFEFYNPYKIIFTNNIIKPKLIEKIHLKNMCFDNKACIVHDLFYIRNYDYELKTYYGFNSLIDDNVIDIENMFNIYELEIYSNSKYLYKSFQKFTTDKNRFYQSYDYTNYEKENKILEYNRFNNEYLD